MSTKPFGRCKKTYRPKGNAKLAKMGLENFELYSHLYDNYVVECLK